MRLLTLGSDQKIIEYLEELEKESKALRSEALRICWYMRGSITYDDAMQLSNEDREIIGKLINENLETTKKSGMPFF
jgi:hypothetical protein